MCLCVCSTKMPFPKFSLIYLKLMSKAETVNFPSKHDDCRWFPFQTVKLVTERFGKCHVPIGFLLWFVRVSRSASLTLLTSLAISEALLACWIPRVSVPTCIPFPLIFDSRSFLYSFCKKATFYNTQTLRGQTYICIQWYQKWLNVFF